MKKFTGFLLIFLMLTGFNSRAFANAFNMETITVSNTVIGFTSSAYDPKTGAIVQRAVFTVEGAQIRFAVDGTTPTTTVGFLGEIGDIITINGQHDIQTFRAVRITNTNAVIQPIYFDGL